MKNATMLYKSPGPYEIHGGHFDYIIVDADAIEAAKADGWFETTDEAKNAFAEVKVQGQDQDKLDAEPTRAELETKAKELGIQFGKKAGNGELSKLIQAKLGG